MTHISISDAVAYSQKWKHFNTCSGLDMTTTNVSCLSSGSVEMEQALLMINVLRKPMNWRVVRFTPHCINAALMSGSLLDLNTLEALISIFQPRDARRCGESSWSWSQLKGEGTWVAFLFSVMDIYKPFEVKRHTPPANFEAIPQLTRASRFQAPMVYVLLPAFLLRPLHWKHAAGSKTDTSTKWTWDCSLEVTQFGWHAFLGR